jgi:hypothetical protein
MRHPTTDAISSITCLAAIKAWGNRESVCRAGLFHSIYGTNIFTVSSAGFDQRARIRTAIGEEAEQLAHLFCSTNRPIALLQALIANQCELEDVVNGGTHRLVRADLVALIEIEVANFLEHPEDREVIAQIAGIIRSTDPAAVSSGAAAALAAYLDS